MLSYLITLVFRHIRAYIYYHPPHLITLLEASTVPVKLRLAAKSSPNLPYPSVCVVIPDTIEQVQDAIRCAQKAGARVLVHSGKLDRIHEGLVIDLSRFSDVDGGQETDIVAVGAGVKLGTIDMAIYKRGRRVFPHGGFPSKIINGHALLGGFSYLSRLRGLAVDSVVALTVVLADASVVTASATENADLFWALCGAGPSFGVVTELKIRTYPAPEEIIVYSYHYRFRKLGPWRMTQALMAVRRFASSKAAAELGLGVEVSRGGVFILRGVYFGSWESFKTELVGLVGALDAIHIPAEKREVRRLNWIEYLYEMPEGKRVPLSYRDTVVKGEFNLLSKPLYESGAKQVSMRNIFSMFCYLFAVGKTCSTEWCVVIDLHGGRNSAIASRPLATEPMSTSCYGHRDCFFMYQFCAIQASDDDKDGVRSLVEAMAASLSRDAARGVRSRFAADLRDKLYYDGDAGERLGEIKARVDPEDMFCNTFALDDDDDEDDEDEW